MHLIQVMHCSSSGNVPKKNTDIFKQMHSYSSACHSLISSKQTKLVVRLYIFHAVRLMFANPQRETMQWYLGSPTQVWHSVWTVERIVVLHCRLSFTSPNAFSEQDNGWHERDRLRNKRVIKNKIQFGGLTHRQYPDSHKTLTLTNWHVLTK